MSSGAGHKLPRELVRHVERQFPGLHAEVTDNHAGHRKLHCVMGDQTVTVSFACSPKTGNDNVLNFVRQQVRREFKKKGVEL